jgi:hypothetical protein
MQRPIAFKLLTQGKVELHQVRMEPMDISSLRSVGSAPAIVVARKINLLPESGVGLIDATEIVAAKDGDWTKALLITLEDTAVGDHIAVPENIAASEDIAPPAQIFDLMPEPAQKNGGDERFLEFVRTKAPALEPLCRVILAKVRSAGVDGELIKTDSDRWVNSPVNSFTLKVQPRAGNIQFTLYGSPSSYQADDFLLPDQNSYSRGWIKNEDDAQRFAELVVQSHARKSRRGGHR